MTRSALLCDHANEAPVVCRCSIECSCKWETCRPHVTRNMSTPESREFWEGVEDRARKVATWPCWKRGIKCPGSCCNCDPLPGHVQVLCLNLALAGYCAAHAPPKPTTRWAMLEIDP